MAIHPTAIVDANARIPDSAEIGPFCVVEGTVQIGERCRLYQNVYITGTTQIGDDCVLHPGVVVGHEPQDIKYDGATTYCRIGHRTVLRENVTVHRGTEADTSTIIGNDCLLFAGCHVGHNCEIDDHAVLINNTMLSGHVYLEDHVTIGGGAGIHQFARIGRLAMIAGNASVSKDIIPFSLADRDGHIAGLNRVGLRRAEMPRADIDELSAAFRALFEKKRGFEQSVQTVASMVTGPSGIHLARFLQAESKRGVAGRPRK